MRAGKLDRLVTIISPAALQPDAAGTPMEVGSSTETPMRAQLVQSSTDEYMRAAGEVSDTVIVFRTRWLDGVTTLHSVRYESRDLNIREVKEIGRREGLELRCVEVRSNAQTGG